MIFSKFSGFFSRLRKNVIIGFGFSRSREKKNFNDTLDCVISVYFVIDFFFTKFCAEIRGN